MESRKEDKIKGNRAILQNLVEAEGSSKPNALAPFPEKHLVPSSPMV
jgi:hypothetical protein